MYKLTATMPPTLPELIGIGDSALPIVGLYYDATTARWTDGLSNIQMDFYDAWRPFFYHQAIQTEIKRAGIRQSAFGGDDCLATHMLILNRNNNKMFISTYIDGTELINIQPQPEHVRIPVHMSTSILAGIIEEAITITSVKIMAPIRSRHETQALIDKMNRHLDMFFPNNN